MQHTRHALESTPFAAAVRPPSPIPKIESEVARYYHPDPRFVRIVVDHRSGGLTLDLVASYGYLDQNGTLFTPIGSKVTSGQVGVQLGLPIYQGGSISSRAREAAFNYDKSKQDLQNARRSAALAAQQAFLASVNGVAQVNALEQALVSSTSAYDSNKLGYEVGVRINIDVLNAQQQLYQTRRDLALARYTLITSRLKLQAAGGIEGEQAAALLLGRPLAGTGLGRGRGGRDRRGGRCAARQNANGRRDESASKGIVLFLFSQ